MKVNNKFLAGEALIQGRTNTIKEVSQKANVDPYGGHEYVDLGLPSGTLWAKWNVGATSETDTGLYFQWGDTQGYTAEQIGSGEGKKAFNWDDYKWTEDGGSTMSKYNSTDGKTVLDLEDDAVATNWGGSWKMPTEAQFQELFNTTYVTYTWVTDYLGSGINGSLYTSVTNGNTLFFPAASAAIDGSMSFSDGNGLVWSNSIFSNGVSGSYSLILRSNNTAPSTRCNGQSVRGVIG